MRTAPTTHPCSRPRFRIGEFIEDGECLLSTVQSGPIPLRDGHSGVGVASSGKCRERSDRLDIDDAELILNRLVDTGVVLSIDGHYFVTDQRPGLQTALWDTYQLRLMREATRREDQLSAGGE